MFFYKGSVAKLFYKGSVAKLFYKGSVAKIFTRAALPNASESVIAVTCHSEQGIVARWFIFSKPKISICVSFGGSCNGRCWYMYFMSIWSIFGPFGIF
jgi:hypothetical protein